MKHHGIGVGYRYPHEFEGADVDQQYLPDELDGRARYYLPDRPGLRGDDRASGWRAARRPATRAGGRPRRRRTRPGPGVDAMKAARASPKREESRESSPRPRSATPGHELGTCRRHLPYGSGTSPTSPSSRAMTSPGSSSMFHSSKNVRRALARLQLGHGMECTAVGG